VGRAKKKICTEALFLIGKTAQKHAVFVKPISCTDRWFHAILKTKDFFYTPSRAAFFNFFIPEPHFMLSMNCRTALTSILHP
jgi:hypothetical protein